VITTNGTLQTFHSRQPGHGGDRKIFEVMITIKPAYKCLTMKQTTGRTIRKLPNSEQSYKGKVKTHNYINRKKSVNRKTVKKTKARTWISNVICRGIFVFSELTLAVGVPFVDSDVIVDHHCLQHSSQNGVDPLTNPRQSIILHNVLSAGSPTAMHIETNDKNLHINV
jgi:hypothetical protein